VDRRDVGHRRKRILEDEGPSTILGSERDGNRAAERSAHEDDVVRLDSGSLGEPMLSRASVGDTAGFIRPTLAVAVAAVIEDEYGCLKSLAELGPKFSDRRDIFAVSMAIQDCVPGVLMRDEPAVELGAVG
jgi:hypothetical protein